MPLFSSGSKTTQNTSRSKSAPSPSQGLEAVDNGTNLKGNPVSTSSVSVSTPSTAVLIAQIQEKRREAREAEARAQQEQQRVVRRQLAIRADVSHEELGTTYRTLHKLGYIKLDDLMVPPGFNLLDDGEIGSVNTWTPEWRLWSDLKALAEDAQHLAGALIGAGDDPKLAGHWDSKASA